ncbi:MAG: hypothetical protein V1783_04905 [Bacteroidota bacterium]
MKNELSKPNQAWNYAPPLERKLKEEYESLHKTIKQKEKKLKNCEESIKMLKLELKQLKPESERIYSDLIQHQREIAPTISITYSKNSKTINYKDKMVQTKGNQSWSISMRIKGKLKNIYIGTTKEICWRLDDIDGINRWDSGGYKIFLLKKSLIMENRIKNRLKELISPHIVKALVEIRERTGDVQEFIEQKKIKGMNYLTPI